MRNATLLPLLFLCVAGAGYFGAWLLDHRTHTPGPSPVLRDAQPGTAPTASPGTKSHATKVIHGLVRVTDPSLVVDLRYATTHNFTGQCIYQQACCVLTQHTAQKVLAANAELQTLGYRLKIWDAYRPLSAQRILWQKYPHGGYVADPQHGSVHNRGAAVDVTLVDGQGREVLMPSAFDEFSPRAASDYPQAPPAALRNRNLLARVMRKHGFRGIRHEWWHFEDTSAAAYPVQDLPFRTFEE